MVCVRADMTKKAHTRPKWLSFIWKSNFVRSTREAWTKAQSHQVEFNWLQLFNSSFFSSWFVSFAHTFQSVCPYIVCAFYNLFFYIVWVFCWKSQLRIQWSAKQSTQEKKEGKWTREKHEKTKRTAEKNTVKIFQFPLQLFHKSSNFKECAICAQAKRASQNISNKQPKRGAQER